MKTKEFDRIFWNCVCGKKEIVKAIGKGEVLILDCECAEEFIDQLKKHELLNQPTKERTS